MESKRAVSAAFLALLFLSCISLLSKNVYSVEISNHGALGSKINPRTVSRSQSAMKDLVSRGSSRRRIVDGMLGGLAVAGAGLFRREVARGYPLPDQAVMSDVVVKPKSELDSFFDTALEVQQKLKEKEALRRLRGALPEAVKDREKELLELRVKAENEAKETLGALQRSYEDGAKLTQEGKLCATPFGVDVVGITELIALTGALVSGISSRKRKEELQRVNEQLRKINFALRKQARIGGSRNPSVSSGMLFNPDLNYAYPKPPPAVSRERPAELSSQINITALSEPERQCVIALKEGKQLLKSNVRSASVRFKKALIISHQLKDTDLERKAARGLGACFQRQFMYDDAIKYYLKAEKLTEKRGDAIEYDMRDLYNAIADVYADMGDTDKALDYYDKYLAVIGTDTATVVSAGGEEVGEDKSDDGVNDQTSETVPS